MCPTAGSTVSVGGAMGQEAVCAHRLHTTFSLAGTLSRSGSCVAIQSKDPMHVQSHLTNAASNSVGVWRWERTDVSHAFAACTNAQGTSPKYTQGISSCGADGGAGAMGGMGAFMLLE